MHKLRNDIILILILLFICISIFLFYIFTSQEDNLEVIIYSDNQVYKVLDINENQTIEVSGVKIVIASGYVYVESSTCPDQICVHQHKIKASGQTITCLPNKVFVKIEGKEVDIGI